VARLKINRGLFNDVKLCVGSEVFPEHRGRMVLTAGSKFLATLFDGQFKDSFVPIVNIHKMDPCAFATARCTVRDSSALE